MRLKFLTVAFVLATFISAFVACTDDSCDVTPRTVSLETPDGNPTFQLGRMLFYDSHLSVNASISCASCHKQSLAFSDNVPFSKGFENRPTLRNSLPIQNIGLNNFQMLNLFWDGREAELQTMVLKPILNHVEMGMGTESDIIQRVRNYPYYADLFNKAFGSSEITGERISSALSSFVGSITAQSSRFDKSMFSGMELNALEKQGQELFITKYNCNSCHKIQLPGFYESNPGGFVNIGLDVDYADKGRFNVTQNPEDAGKFKIPDLHNVALTAPYMHDGRFATLNEVLEHYSHGIADNVNLDPRLKGASGAAMRMNISDQEKTAIIAFLNTLTDFSMITNKSFSDPFVVH